MIWAIAWRNIWRNKLRSMVIISAIAIGIFAGVFTWAFYRGMVEQRVQSAITTESSHLQLHHPKYLTNPDQRFFMNDCNSMADSLSGVKGIKAVTRRVLVNAMILSAETGSGVKVFGIQPDEEKSVTNIYARITEGNYLEGKKTPIVIGEKLAEKLSVRVRSKIVLTLQTMDGTLTSGLFRISGLYRTSNAVYDEANIFVKRSDLVSLINLDSNACHEMAVMLDHNDFLDDVANTVQSNWPGTEVKTWRELMPEVNLVEESMDIYMYFFLVIILVALIFGIINTMLMAVLERTKELGMLMAVGMNKGRVFIMILLETVLLSFTGGVIGIMVAFVMVLFTRQQGIDLTFLAEGIEQFGYESVIYPVADADIHLKVALMVLITGIVAALYPAWKAIRLSPAEALHIDN